MKLLEKVRFWCVGLRVFIKRDKIFYIRGNENLPPALTAEEEADLLNKYEHDKSGTVKNLLIEHNLRLVVYIARKFENTNVGIEDLISIGTIGLIKAINTFNTSKNIKLATYASRCIENEILMHLRRIGRTKVEMSLDEPLNTDGDGNELLLSDVLGTENDLIYHEVEADVEKQILRQLIMRLTARERQIMELRFGLNGDNEKTQKEVANLLGISQSYISRLEKRILLKMREEFKAMA